MVDKDSRDGGWGKETDDKTIGINEGEKEEYMGERNTQRKRRKEKKD